MQKGIKMTYLKQKVWTKKTLYIICFIFLTVIEILINSAIESLQTTTMFINISDVFRGLYSVDFMIIARNCTGIVIMLFVFSSYNKKQLFNVPNVIWTIMCVVAICLLPYYKRWTNASFHLYQMQTVIINIWWMVIAIAKIIKEIFMDKTLKVKLGVAGAIWIVMSLFMFLSVNDNNIWPAWYLLMFGILFLTNYSAKDKAQLWEGMIDGSLWGFIIVQILAFTLRPYDELRYKGMHGNCNMAGIYYLIIYVMCLYKLHCLELKGAKKWRKIVCLLLAGMTLSLQFMSLSRTAWIVAVIVTLLYGIIVVKKLWNKKWHQVLFRGVLIVLAMAIMFVPTFMAARWIPAKTDVRLWHIGEYGKSWYVYVTDEDTSEKYIELDEFMEAALGRVAYIFKTAKAYNPLVMKSYALEEVELVESDLLTDTAMRIRLTIYREYLGNLEWFGHTNADGHLQVKDMEDQIWHAQNVWLQVLYFYGIFAGVLFLGLTMVILVINYKKIIKNPENPYAIIPFLFCIIFFCFGLMEVVWYLGQLSLFLIYFVHQPLDNTHLIEKRSLESEDKN